MPTMMPVPPELTVPEQWFYRDPQGNVQGPYETSSMRQWHEARYFTSDLPIKLRQWMGFHPLGAVFPDSETAFNPNAG
jgi:PERQ amino acid-rich with GYF domain-containing protein